MKNFQRKSVAFFALVVTTGSLTSCAAIRKRQSAEPSTTQAAQATQPAPSAEKTRTETAPATAPTAEQVAAPAAQEYKKLQAEITRLNARLASIENRLGSVTENLNTTRSHLDNWVSNQKAKPAPVVSHSAEHGGTRAEPPAAPTDPLAGYSDDAATRSYRKSALLFKAQRYREAAASYSDFLEKYPDHPLAGSAQFYVGEAYFMQGEFKQAVQEFQRVLTSYDRSAYVAQTLREMAEAEDRLQKTEDAARHRQLLTSLFPHSPFALTKTAQIETSSPESAPTAPAATAPAHSQNKLDEPPLTEPLRTHEAESGNSTP